MYINDKKFQCPKVLLEYKVIYSAKGDQGRLQREMTINIETGLC
jgi:hypothetical protein